MLKVFAPSSLCVKNQMLWRYPRTRMLPRGFLLVLLLWFDGWSESVMQWIIFFWKPFWFFLRIFSISGSMQLRSRPLETLAVIEVSATVVLNNYEITFLGEEEGAALDIYVYIYIYIYIYTLIASLRLRWFLWRDHRLELFAPSSLCVDAN